MIDTIQRVHSLLDKGRIINYVIDDIDGNDRQATGSSFNIGAIEFISKRLVSDFEVAAITSPGAYRNTFIEEQIMLPKNADQSYTFVRAIVKNNGQVHLANVPVTATVLQGTSSVVSESQIVTLAVGEEREITFFTTPARRFTPAPYTSSQTAYPTM